MFVSTLSVPTPPEVFTNPFEVKFPRAGMFAELVAVIVPNTGELEALKIYVLPELVMARGPLAVAEFKQLVQESVCEF